MAEQSRVYGNFRGVDFTSDPAQVSPHRFSYCVNMWKDYESQNGIAVETFPGYRRLTRSSAGTSKVNGIHRYKGRILLHTGTTLWEVVDLKSPTGQGGLESIHVGLADHKSTSFVWGDHLYILDGEKYLRVTLEKSSITGTDVWKIKNVNDVAYEPTVEVNGTEVEQRNILSNKKKKTFLLGTMESTHSPYMVFADATMVTGENNVVFTGFSSTPSRVIKIPDTVTIDEKVKTVVEILNFDLSDQGLFDIVIPSTVQYIGGDAFKNMISNQNINRIWFGGSSELWAHRRTTWGLGFANLEDSGRPIFFGRMPDADVLYYEGNLSDTDVADIADRYSATFTYVEKTSGSTLKGSYVSVMSGLSEIKKRSATATEQYDLSAEDKAFPQCTLVQSFNGNLFFSGSPAAPSKIWWCAAPADTSVPDPSYIGEFNYDLCGLDDSPIVSMMAQSSALTVFKQKSDQDATIYYYTPIESSSDLVPSRYAESEGGSGIACIGSSCNFLDDAVFLSKRGLEGIQKTAVNLERSVVHRSSFVDAKLQTEELSKAWLLEWKGYLCVLFPNGHMYLADSRRTASGNEGSEYEWFYVEGLRGYGKSKKAGETPFLYVFDEGTPVYAYADEADLFELSAATETLIDEDGCITLSNGIKVTVKRGVTIDDVASKQAAVDASLGKDAEVYSTSEGTQTVYYTKDGYLCYPSGEYAADESGEDITCAAVIDDVLYFGAGGALYCINTDKRTNKRINEDGKEEECEWHIPNEYYTFCGRRYKSGFVTFADNCGVPHLRKKIIKKSLVVKTKSMDNSKFYLKVGTDRVPFNENEEVHTSGTLDFGALKFDTMDLFDQDKTIVPFRASAKKFVEAQLMLYSDGFKRPFGVYNMAFRFEVTGRVKE